VKDLGQRLAAEHQREPFQLVISVSHCAVKNTPLPAGLTHLCYCLTPARYLWDQFEAYFSGRLIKPLVQVLRPFLQAWDRRGAAKVDKFFVISEFVGARVERVYGRDSVVVYPPVNTSWIGAGERTEQSSRREGFLVVNALVPYKRVELIIEAFKELPYSLTIVGNGPEAARLKRLATPNINFIAHVNDEQLADLYRSSRALIFAAEEDFGMTPIEMQAAGGPVIAFGRGGSLETVVTTSGAETGLLYAHNTTQEIGSAVISFIDREPRFTVRNCISNAAKFSVLNFRESFIRALEEAGFGNSLNVEKKRTAV